MPRHHAPDSLRPVSVQTDFLDTTPASVLYSSGRTRVLCVATLETGVPSFLSETESGWATAEYDLLPASTRPRHPRERGGHVSGRTREIQRLIGRSVRGILDLKKMPGWTLRVDCDVLQADGGTRTAAISGAYIAVELAVRKALREGAITENPIRSALAAISVGLLDGKPYLDLDYEEDVQADVDMNVVQTDGGRFLEIQGTAEGQPFSADELQALLDLAAHGIRQILVVQRKALAAR